MEELISKLNDCINELDDINDALDSEGYNTKELLNAIDNIWEYYKKLNKFIEDSDKEEEPDLYHDMLQDKLDRENLRG